MWAIASWERCANSLLKTIFAREIYASQKRFIADVAHELRTPLSTIKTSAEVALIDTGLPKDARESFKEILGELERISGIIDNLLSLNTLTRPEQMHFKNLDLIPLAEATVARHKLLARERGIRLRLYTKPGSISWANAVAVEQIMTNLIKNALLYTPSSEGGVVLVRLRPQDGRILFEVEDSGVGISQEELAHIFEPFYRADTSRTQLKTKTGSGLGLTIVHEMVKAMQGEIVVRSRRRHGTTVSVYLPQGGAAAKEREALTQNALSFTSHSAGS